MLGNINGIGRTQAFQGSYYFQQKSPPENSNGIDSFYKNVIMPNKALIEKEESPYTFKLFAAKSIGQDPKVERAFEIETKYPQSSERDETLLRKLFDPGEKKLTLEQNDARSRLTVAVNNYFNPLLRKLEF